MWQELKKRLIGMPLPNWEHKHQRLTKKIALAVFSSDAMSSVAYSTEEILLVLVLAGSGALFYSLPITVLIIGLLWILVLSYRQTIKAYPKGAGSYLVVKDNLGKTPSLVAAGSLLLDYVLTVAVSVAAGIAALTSAFPILFPHKVILGIIIIMIIMMINLKGVKESGLFFSVPTYAFIISYLAMIGVGIYKYLTGTLTPSIVQDQTMIISGLTLFLLLRAFSGGCTALTGVEAISDGVLAFKKPESVNARKTLVVMGVIMSVFVLGTAFLAYQLHLSPVSNRTLVSLIAESLFSKSIFFYIIQASTMLILFLAANTAFADFPRLCYFLARDRFLPKQFMQLGDRLVFSNGIILLALASASMIIIFSGSVHSLIPLYAVGVFTSFTLSQLGMIRHHLRLKEKHWVKYLIINSIGFVSTLIVLIIIIITKFTHGAWIVITAIILLILLFKAINRHYRFIDRELKGTNLSLEKHKHLMVILVPTLNKGVCRAIHYSKNLSSDLRAVHISISNREREKLVKDWNLLKPGINLEIIDSPYRKVVSPFMHYLDTLEKDNPGAYITVIIPEFVTKKFWHNLLHNQTAIALKTAIYLRKHTSYIPIQYHLNS